MPSPSMTTQALLCTSEDCMSMPPTRPIVLCPFLPPAYWLRPYSTPLNHTPQPSPPHASPAPTFWGTSRTPSTTAPSAQLYTHPPPPPYATRRDTSALYVTTCPTPIYLSAPTSNPVLHMLHVLVHVEPVIFDIYYTHNVFSPLSQLRWWTSPLPGTTSSLTTPLFL